MRRPEPAADWPESWRTSLTYDRLEIFGEVSHYGYAYAYARRRASTLRLITEVLRPGARILDIAAAQGNFSLSLAELGYHVTWNDLRAELEPYVRLKHEHGTIDYRPGNAFELHFERPFDGVLITEVIEHVAHPDEFLRNTARMVRPGGYIVMTTPNGGYFRNTLPRFSDCQNPSVYEAQQFKPNSDGHIFLLHGDEVERLATESGLRLDRLEFLINPLTYGHLGTEPLLRLLPASVVSAAEWATGRLPDALQRWLLVQMAARFERPAGVGEAL